MLFFKIIFYALIFIICENTIKCADVQLIQTGAANATQYNPTIVSSLAAKCNFSASNAEKSQSYGLKLRLPIMDVDIQNQRNMRLLQESQKQLLFILHGNELFQLFIDREEKRLALIAILDGNVQDAEHIGAEIIAWNDYFLLVVVLEEYVEVYQIAEDIIVERAKVAKDPKRSNESAPHFEPIQELMLAGKYRKIYLIEPFKDRIFLIVAVHFTKLHGQINTFEWINTYFEPIEEITLPPMHVFNLVGKPAKYLLTGRNRSKSRTLLTMYAIEASTMRLKSRQTFTIDTRAPHLVTYGDKSYIFACSKIAKKCSIYKLSDGHFSVYRQRSNKNMNFTQLVAGAHFLVGTHSDEVLVFPNIRLDCYTAFKSNETDISSIKSHVNEHGEDFILLIYMRPFHTRVRVVEVESDSGEVLGKMLINGTDFEEINLQNQAQHQFEKTIGGLRSMLLKNKPAMDVFQKITAFFAPKLKSIRLRNPVNLGAGNIGIVRIVDKNLRSPMQLLQRVQDLSKRYRGERVKRELGILPHNVTESQRNHLRVKQLKVCNLLYKHNIIEGFHLDSTTSPMPILSIIPKLKTKMLKTPEMQTHQTVRTPRQPSLGLFDFGSKTKRISKLNVTTINEVPWSEFYDSIFLKNRDKKVQGRLVFQSMTTVQNLWTPLLNGLVVDDLFNLVQPQVIRSNILIAGFFVSDMQADKVNGLDFAKEIAFSGMDIEITTPVVMHELGIKGDLLIADNSTRPRFSGAEDENFQQTYTGKVVIKGSLTINNLWKENIAQLKVDDTPFAAEDLKQNFLLNKTEQTFSHPITFGNLRIDAPSLSTNFLNDQPTADHLLKTGEAIETEKDTTTPLMLIFMKAHIKGQLNCNSYNSRLAELSKNAIRHGEVANITGIKNFRANLTTEHLMAMELNDLPVSDLLQKTELGEKLTLQGNKTFEKVVVTGDANIEHALNANYLNSLPLNELLNYDYHLENLTLPHKLNATNIVFHKINDISFDKIFTNFKIKDNNLVLHKDLIIEGNAKFSEKLDVDLINNIDWNTYQQSLVRQHEHAIINGTKEFLKDFVITKELIAQKWNNMKIVDIFDNILRKSHPQSISGIYSFEELCATNVDVSIVNDVPVASFIDRETPEIVIEGDIFVPKVVIYGDVEGIFERQNDLKKFVQLIQDLPRKPWRNVHVLGNAQWNTTSSKKSTQDLQLAYLYKNAVTNTGNHTISGNVKLRRPLIIQMYTKASFPKGIDFAYVAKDALLRNSNATQTIMSEKFFARPVMLENMTVNGILHTQLINDIDILRLNASLYRLSTGEPIMGPLHFRKAPIIGHLAVQGNVNGLQKAQIYHLSNATLPPLSIKKLFINNSIQLQDINGMSLEYLLRNRITKNGEALEVFGYLTFENLVLDKEILLQSINGIPIDSLVLKQSPNLQAITGSKVIAGDLVLAGPAHVIRLNGEDLIESYQHSIFTNANYTFDNLTIEQATFENGLQLSKEMLAPVVGKQNINQNIKQNTERTNDITNAIKRIDNILSKDKKLSNKTHLMYLDYDSNMQTVWQRAVNLTIDKSYQFIINRLTICERQMLQVQISLANQTIFLHNTTSNIITIKQNDLSVRVENYCKPKYRKIRSKITFSTPSYKRTFGMKKFIENIDIFTPNQNRTYLLLHVVDFVGQHNEVRLLQLNKTKDDLIDRQSLTRGIGRVMRFFQFSQNYSVLISAALVKNYPAVSIYTYSKEKQQFVLTQVIDGDYDIIEIQQVAKERYQLLLSCVGCQRISIYEYDTTVSGIYRIFQFVKLNQRIDKLLPFSLADGSRYLLVLSEHGEDFYHLYSYSNIQGWLPFTYGYFPDIEWALPLVARGQQLTKKDDMLLLLCGQKQCEMVKIVVQ